MENNFLLIIDGSSLLSTQFYGNLPREILFAKTQEEKEKYYYIQINVRTILVIKKECVENLNELEELLEKKLTSRFFPNKK